MTYKGAAESLSIACWAGFKVHNIIYLLIPSIEEGESNQYSQKKFAGLPSSFNHSSYLSTKTLPRRLLDPVQSMPVKGLLPRTSSRSSLTAAAVHCSGTSPG